MFSTKKPSEIRFSQDSIATHWKDNSSRIGVTLDQLLKDEITPDNIPTIIVSYKNGFLYTSDNRRLWVFKKLQDFGKCESIKVQFGNIQPWKFTTNNRGTSIFVRGDPGGKIWKMWGEDQNAAATNIHTECTSSRLTNREERNDNVSAFAEALEFDETEHIRPGDIQYFQTRPYTNGESLGKLLDDWLIMDGSKHTLEIHKLKESYFTLECDKLWVWKILEKFGKNPKIRLKLEKNPFEKYGDRVLDFFKDSLEFNFDKPIGGMLWKNIDRLKKLPTVETIECRVEEIYFTQSIISDTYENTSIAKVLADSYAKMTIPRRLRVVKSNGKMYALDNEMLWVTKEVQNLKGTNLSVKVEIKIEMDEFLFQGFASDHIQKATIQTSSFSHTNEESFIFECIKKMSA